MKTLTQIVTTIVTAAALTACASIRLQPIEDQLRAKYGCLGVGEVGFVALFMNPDDAEKRAIDKAKQDYKNKCLSDLELDENSLFNVIYDPRTNTAYAFSVNDDLKE